MRASRASVTSDTSTTAGSCSRPDDQALRDHDAAQVAVERGAVEGALQLGRAHRQRVAELDRQPVLVGDQHAAEVERAAPGRDGEVPDHAVTSSTCSPSPSSSSSARRRGRTGCADRSRSPLASLAPRGRRRAPCAAPARRAARPAAAARGRSRRSPPARHPAIAARARATRSPCDTRFGRPIGGISDMVSFYLRNYSRAGGSAIGPFRASSSAGDSGMPFARSCSATWRLASATRTSYCWRCCVDVALDPLAHQEQRQEPGDRHQQQGAEDAVHDRVG